jgi:uncharacterized membrane protein (DUF2068 family)
LQVNFIFIYKAILPGLSYHDGLWYQKIWAEILVLVMVGIGVFPEIHEITKEVKPVKIIILIINLIVFGYLAQKLYKEFQHRKSAPPN